jgi:hypothetical protein
MGKITEFVRGGKGREPKQGRDVPLASSPAGPEQEGYTAQDIRERNGEFPHTSPAAGPPAGPHVPPASSPAGPAIPTADGREPIPGAFDAAARDAVAVLLRPVPPPYAIRAAAAQRLQACLDGVRGG